MRNGQPGGGGRSTTARRGLGAVCVLAAGEAAFGVVSKAGAAEAWHPALALCLGILWSGSARLRAAAALLANVLHRAVTPREGSHRAVFEYRPLGLRVSAALSLATAAIISAVAREGLGRRRAAGEEIRL